MDESIVLKFKKTVKNYPEKLLDALAKVSEKSGADFYFVGGTVRDFLLGRVSHDIDIGVSGRAEICARLMAEELGGGSVVDLSGPEDETFRVVWNREQIDFSSFRANVATIEEDLALRDFTINAIAVHLSVTGYGSLPAFIDPMGGRDDLQAARIRHCPGAFAADPVRMVRGYRLSATLGFTLEKKTLEAVRQHAPLIRGVTAERIHYELALIFQSPCTAGTVAAMNEAGLLRHLLPELFRGKGVAQPGFHHLDVLGHSFLALEMMEQVLADPERFFPGNGSRLNDYLAKDGTVESLKWAALLHDIGKPATREVRSDKNGRVTFYRHDEVGRDLFKRFADRLKWSKVESKRTAGLIGMHMHPFHLCNVQRKKMISRRAALKLCQRAGSDLPGLFLLAMSDSLASKGALKPERMEDELAELFDTVQRIFDRHIEPVLRGPRLVTGNDLISRFSLVPGPLFKEILSGLETARVEGKVPDRQAAFDWVEEFLRQKDQFT